MSSCDGCPSKSSCSKASEDKGCSVILPKFGHVKNVIGVMSGKGGVGKSTVTGILATKLRSSGYKVGVLDADITGPSMPRFFGINTERATISPTEDPKVFKFIPVETKQGIKVISLNLLTEKEEEPVIWRGPVINGVLNQMYGDTEWGELDYLLIDMPPGTGDIALTVMQSLPINSIVIVSTPQDMVSMIVKKVVIMSLIYGPQVGMLTGFLMGIIDLLFGGYIVHPAQLLLDYPLAYMFIGLSGYLKPNVKKDSDAIIKSKLISGVLIGMVGRLTCHVLSGIIFFSEYAKGANPFIYSLNYNLSFLSFEFCITSFLVAMFPLKQILATNNINIDSK